MNDDRSDAVHLCAADGSRATRELIDLAQAKAPAAFDVFTCMG
ncbi:hypothetical protein [Arthrobacter sp. zg-Y877]|nr:hypothetical protein [Arthrobacter sp. zg-Y877]MDM7991516.1 hypothetical protein [Arthrobacter sp. zg-Y877]